MPDISRADALALINQQNANEIWQTAAESSAALRTFRRINMTAKQHRMPVIDVLPTAAFLTSDTGTKATTEQVWTNKMLEAEELATIVPIPENVFDDSNFNVWNEVRPRISEAVGAKIDGAVFFGTNKPASWPDSLEDGARAAGNVYSAATAGDLAEDINQTMAMVEEDGFDPDVIYSRVKLRASLRGLRDTTGQPIFATDFRGTTPLATVYGIQLEWVKNGSWVEPVGANGAHVIVGDKNMAILGIRQDIEYKILTEATLTNGAGVVVYSLAEQDMIALRAKMRLAFQVADPTTVLGGTGAYPFAVLGA